MKGIKTILGALAAASLLFSVSAYAQENGNRDENGKVVRGAYETNKAFDNIFIGIGAGANSVVGETFQPATWGKLGIATDIHVGKWFTPSIGIRAGWRGLTNDARINFAPNDAFIQNYFHGDFLWNLANTFFGYKETRFWSPVLHMDAGVITIGQKGSLSKIFANKEYAMGPGLYNIFRLSNRVNLTLDLMMLVGKAAAYTNAAGTYVGFPSAILGVSFNLGKTNFDRHSSITPVVIPVPFTTEQYNALADKVAALEKENAELKEKIAALENEVAPLRNLVNGQTYLYENGSFTAVDVKPGSPLTLYFDCGSAKLSAREKAHLEYFTDTVIDADTKLLVSGYADKQTGSARRNQQLSEQRVKTVVDLLTKAGASESNIETAAHGADIQLFDGAAKNRVVTIELK